MPRVKGSPKKFVKSQANASTWIFLMKEEGLESQDANAEIIKLKHPATNQSASFVFGPGDATIQEIVTFDETKRSWLMNNSAKSDGKFNLSTPIDPLFLVLPYLRKSHLAEPLDQCLRDDDYPEVNRLQNCHNLKLNCIGDIKGDAQHRAYKYNEDKTMLWLKKKVEKVAEIVRQKGIHVSHGAVSANFVKSSKYEAGTDTEYLKYAHGIVSEYLAEDLSQKLLQHLNLPDESEQKKRKLTTPKETTEEKRPKKQTQAQEEPPKNGALDLTKPEKPAKPPTVSKKDLARQKAAAGSKNITSFFKKK